ncbi:Gfo/Idh/MocA family oxidoreductase [Cellulomonas sp. ATA003]|uniref:Gfo/Idh/MocA family protein n=1 Tax=Cellulomonas sp. ATA003 TaxID=3073064 RepID=UPI0028738639|nr:Gfo/Idh/MocA family oxidoreductase [Cellulomonas sp. ATA003]WNB86483.1 Gfo/Idh/MocA family oxidoreductase [Cellulomonas sp. ATA003]
MSAVPTFATVPSSPQEPLPVVAVGAGAMGRAWLATLSDSPEVALVGIVDLDLDAARRAATGLGRPDLPVGSDAVALAEGTGARAVIDVTVPAAHHPVTTAALFAGLPVLGEKPVADTLARALSLAAAAETTGQLFMVSQSRRWNPQLAALKGMADDLGDIGAVTTEFFKAPRFGGFRDEMAHPLLVDMAIHAFDSARYLLGAEPVAAYCETWNPPWSWYAGDASASVLFEMEGGARYGYHGSWCAPGAETSWNGSWRVSGARGTARWDGDDEPVMDADVPPTDRPRSPHEGIAGALGVFCAALRTGEPPMGEVHENTMSLAMVEAAVESAATGRRVLVDDVLARAHERAVAEETHPQVREVLRSWSSVRSALAGTAHRGPGGPAAGG